MFCNAAIDETCRNCSKILLQGCLLVIVLVIIVQISCWIMFSWALPRYSLQLDLVDCTSSVLSIGFSVTCLMSALTDPVYYTLVSTQWAAIVRGFFVFFVALVPILSVLVIVLKRIRSASGHNKLDTHDKRDHVDDKTLQEQIGATKTLLRASPKEELQTSFQTDHGVSFTMLNLVGISKTSTMEPLVARNETSEDVMEPVVRSNSGGCKHEIGTPETMGVVTECWRHQWRERRAKKTAARKNDCQQNYGNWLRGMHRDDNGIYRTSQNQSFMFDMPVAANNSMARESTRVQTDLKELEKFIHNGTMSLPRRHTKREKFRSLKAANDELITLMSSENRPQRHDIRKFFSWPCSANIRENQLKESSKDCQQLNGQSLRTETRMSIGKCVQVPENLSEPECMNQHRAPQHVTCWDVVSDGVGSIVKPIERPLTREALDAYHSNFCVEHIPSQTARHIKDQESIESAISSCGSKDAPKNSPLNSSESISSNLSWTLKSFAAQCHSAEQQDSSQQQKLQQGDQQALQVRFEQQQQQEPNEMPFDMTNKTNTMTGSQLMGVTDENNTNCDLLSGDSIHEPPHNEDTEESLDLMERRKSWKERRDKKKAKRLLDEQRKRDAINERMDGDLNYGSVGREFAKRASKNSPVLCERGSANMPPEDCPMNCSPPYPVADQLPMHRRWR